MRFLSLKSEPNKPLSTQNQYFPFHISHSDIQQKRPVRSLNSHWGCNLLIAPFNFNTHLCRGLFPLMIIMAFLQSVTQRVKRSTVPLYHCGTKKRINQRQTMQSVSSWCHIWLNVCDYKGALMQNTSKYWFTLSSLIAGAHFIHSIRCVLHGRVLNKNVEGVLFFFCVCVRVGP